MLKKALFVASAAIALSAASSVPVFAVDANFTDSNGNTCSPNDLITVELPGGDSEFQCPSVTRVPEPSSIVGSLAVGGTLLGIKLLDAKKKRNARKLA
ncbi:MAG: PEP-CTERM sorting domain-containing protein [Nostocales cyanobacterium]|nr:MAG: PEP-CTERM sorting domain-containing protein [Nostocales cyanobacterium]TAF09863.1 MAG: PEP-CTERM sorting domain-containing protein [Nostocales cyanobacterium]